MRAPGDVLLVSCYELGRQPFAVASPAGFLDAAGYRPAALDLGVVPFDADRVSRARFIGISVPMHTAIRLGIRVLRRARSLNPAAHVCLYGLYASLNAEALFEAGADSVIGGEFEGPLLAQVRALEKHATGQPGPPAAVPGVSRPGAPAPPWLERQRFPVPLRSMLPPLSRYARLEIDGREEIAGSTETTRGCLHLCRHCPIPPVYEGRFFVVERETVLEDVDRQVAAGARHVTFGDPDFLNAPGHVLPIVREIARRHAGLTYDVTTKVEHILKHRDLLPRLAETGCVFLVSALEALSDRVLTALRKGHTRAMAVEALHLVEDAGIAFRPSLLPFTPWATLEDFLDLLEWARLHDLAERIDPVQLSIRLLVPPGSLLLDDPVLRSCLGPLDRTAFSYSWTHPDPRMDDLQKRIARLVETAASREEPPRETFARIRAEAFSLAGPKGAPERGGPALRTARRGKAPRLTEPWFC